MNHVERMLAALVRDQEYGIKAAWLSFMACYTHTRAHDGAVINDAGDTINFGRWYSFKAAIECAWPKLWKRAAYAAKERP